MAPDSSAWAEHRLLKLRALIGRYDSSQGRLPGQLGQVVPDLPGLPREKSLLFDPWGHVVSYAPTDTNFLLCSSGLDGVEGTADDLMVWGRRGP